MPTEALHFNSIGRSSTLCGGFTSVKHQFAGVIRIWSGSWQSWL
jgi:hypothetical protein